MTVRLAENTCTKKSLREGRFTYYFELELLSFFAKSQRRARSSCCKGPSCLALYKSVLAVLPLFDHLSAILSESNHHVLFLLYAASVKVSIWSYCNVIIVL